ncbi:SDR family NAD(P)-dependent oxidoreductase [Algoriphagus boritolerans]|uniref:SDR family NAD(P)-dependent oxidoreductase n=1 Tax=Algoriphagus boritolerans TaxID=308111 RepID=UPI000B26FF71
MSRNIIVTGAAGGLGRAVVDKFKREGYHVIALLRPNHGEPVEEADDNYEVDVTDEAAVLDFVREFQMQYNDLDALAMLVGGFAMGDLESTAEKDIQSMFHLNFFQRLPHGSRILPIMKKQQKGTFLFVGARPALELDKAKGTIAYALSKNLVVSLAEILAEEVKETPIRSHVFIPSIIDTQANRESMPDADFSRWVSPKDIAEAMHYTVNNPALRNMTFKLYGGV